MCIESFVLCCFLSMLLLFLISKKNPMIKKRADYTTPHNLHSSQPILKSHPTTFYTLHTHKLHTLVSHILYTAKYTYPKFEITLYRILCTTPSMHRVLHSYIQHTPLFFTSLSILQYTFYNLNNKHIKTFPNYKMLLIYHLAKHFSTQNAVYLTAHRKTLQSFSIEL